MVKTSRELWIELNEDRYECPECGFRTPNLAHFRRHLVLWPGPAGYSGLQCGLPAPLECAVLLDATTGIYHLRFNPADVK